MKTTLLLPAALLIAAISNAPAFAEENVNPAPSAATSATAPTVINGYVYVTSMPTPTQLLKDAEAEGLTVVRMDQTPDQIVVVYRYADGRTRTFAYTPAAAQGTAPAPQTASTNPNATYTVVSTPPPSATVVYTSPAPVYYSPGYYPYYSPWDFWGPLAVGVGIGWVSGGYYGGHGYYGHGYYGHGHGGGYAHYGHH